MGLRVQALPFRVKLVIMMHQRRSQSMSKRRIIVGISGASGFIYGVELLKLLDKAGVESHLVITRGAERTAQLEGDWDIKAVKAMASVSYAPLDMAAAISSGSFQTDGMIVAPCSMRSLAEIASGVSAQLLSRAADVVLKDRRRLVLLVRETPLSTIHLQNMLTVTQAGGIIAPPVPAFYQKPANLLDMVHHTLGRVLDLFEIPHQVVRRWGEVEIADA